MRNESQIRLPRAGTAPGRQGPAALGALFRWLRFLTLTLGIVYSCEAAQPNAALTQTLAVGSPIPASRTGRHLAAALLVAVALILPKLASRLEEELSSSMPMLVGPDDSFGVRQARSALARSSQTGPASLLTEFEAAAPKQIDLLRHLLREASSMRNTTDGAAKLKNLREGLHSFGAMIGVSNVPPVWQLSCALLSFVDGVVVKAKHATPSTFRTLAAGLDLLEDLCQTGVRADLGINPPLRMLAVDDDPISRHAFSLALKKVLGEPDLAGDGEAALALLTHHIYDAVLLDVQMPGMDGIELCAKIRDTALNRATPVIFVTRHDDRETQDRIAKVGCQDLVLKPFPMAELTLKTLMVILESRLQQDRAGATAARRSPALPPVSVAAPKQVQPKPIATPLTQDARLQNAFKPPAQKTEDVECAQPSSALAVTPVPEVLQVAVAPVAAEEATELTDTSPTALNDAILVRASAHIEALQELFQELVETPAGEARQELMRDLELGLRTFTSMAEPAGLSGLLQASRALETRLHELVNQAEYCTAEQLRSVEEGLNSLQDMGQAAPVAERARDPVPAI